MAQLASQVKDPSVSAIVFQSEALLERLGQGFTDSEYPKEALRIRYLFEVLVRRIRGQLVAIQEQRGKDAEAQELLPLDDFAAERANHLGELIQTIYACLRYLHSSDPRSTPPEIQTAIGRLIKQFVTPILNCDPADVVVLVRPRWTVPNYVDVLRELERNVEIADLDPAGETQANDLRSLIDHDWDKSRTDNKPPPKHVAVISFAGLDAYDALDYPLLAHEIGHFIDYAYPDTIHNNPSLNPLDRVVTEAEVRLLFDKFHPPSMALEAWSQNRLDQAYRYTKQVNQQVDVCLRELAADLLATRMLGIPYFIAMAEYLKTMASWPEDIVTYTGYPGMEFRLRHAYQELTEKDGGLMAIERLADELKGVNGGSGTAIERGINYLKGWGRRFAELSRPAPASTDFFTELTRVAQDKVERALPALRDLIRTVIGAEKAAHVRPCLGDLITLLTLRIPPAQELLRKQNVQQGMPDATFGEVLTAGWLYELGTGDTREEGSLTPEQGYGYREYQATCQLLFKAIELQEAREAVETLEKPRSTPFPSWPVDDSKAQSGVASGPWLISSMLRQPPEQCLFIVPYFGMAPVNAATLDIRLGNWFRIARRTRATSIDLSDSVGRERIRVEAQQEEHVRFDQNFALHPGDFALGVSLEYVALPPDLMAFVEGKSSLGRTGLIVATATQVAPGFKGSIVLELFNSGTVPLLLRPGMSIAQLVFVQTDRPLPDDWLYTGKFRCQVKP
jgi:dCTP deaminase